MGACVSSRGCPPADGDPLRAASAASPLARAVADAAVERGARRAASETTTAAASTLTRARLRELEARERHGPKNDDDDDEEEEEEEDWRSALSDAGSERSERSDGSDAPAPAPASQRPPTLARAQPTALHSPTHPPSSSSSARDPPPGPAGDAPSASTAAAWRALERATAHLEEDAVARLEEEEDRAAQRETPASSPNAVAASTPTTSTSTSTSFLPLSSSYASSLASLPRRVARVREGMRLLRSVAAASRAAGGALDLTAFAGTPPRWHAPLSMLLVHAQGVSPLPAPPGLGARDERSGRRVRLPRASRLFAHLRDAFGADARKEAATRLRALRAEAEAEAEKAERQTTPPTFADASTPEGRALALARCLLADAEPPAHLAKPFNPVLGETARAEVVHRVPGDGDRSSRDENGDADAFASPPGSLTRLDPLVDRLGGSATRTVLEQVSHHPPVTAFAVVGDGFAIEGHFQATPRLVGVRRVEVVMRGRRSFTLAYPELAAAVPVRARDVSETNVDVSETNVADGNNNTEPVSKIRVATETWESDYVGFEWLFFPRMKSKIANGQTLVATCASSGLRLEIRHERGRRIAGSVRRVVASADRGPFEEGERRTNSSADDDDEPLYLLRGRYDARVVAEDCQTREVRVLYDADEAASLERDSIASAHAFDLPVVDGAKSTRRVWGETAAAIRARRWDDAGRCKRRVEARERAERARREAAGEKWAPRLFEWSERRGTWTLTRDAADAGEPRGLGGDGPGRGERGDGGGPLGGAEGFADEAESGA